MQLIFRLVIISIQTAGVKSWLDLWFIKFLRKWPVDKVLLWGNVTNFLVAAATGNPKHYFCAQSPAYNFAAFWIRATLPLYQLLFQKAGFPGSDATLTK